MNRLLSFRVILVRLSMHIKILMDTISISYLFVLPTEFRLILLNCRNYSTKNREWPRTNSQSSFQILMKNWEEQRCLVETPLVFRRRSNRLKPFNPHMRDRLPHTTNGCNLIIKHRLEMFTILFRAQRWIVEISYLRTTSLERMSFVNSHSYFLEKI